MLFNFKVFISFLFLLIVPTVSPRTRRHELGPVSIAQGNSKVYRRLYSGRCQSKEVESMHALPYIQQGMGKLQQTVPGLMLSGHRGAITHFSLDENRFSL